jgi:hypothetical protein
VRWQRLVITALAAVLGLFVLACTPEEGKPQTKSPGDQIDDIRTLQLKTWVSERCSPYTINLSSSGRGLIPEPVLHIAGGGWDHVLTYDSGKRIQFTIKIQAKDGCAEGWCIIDDGRFGDARDSLNQYGKAACVYTTKG